MFLRSIAGLLFALAFLAVPVSSEEFHFVEQCRLLDTRNLGGPIMNGTEFNALARSQPGANQGGSAGCGAPTDAEGVVLNITVTGALGAGHLEVYPWNMRPPLPTSRLNYGPGQTIANEVMVQLHPLPYPGFPGDTAWDIAFRPSVAPVHIIADVIGYTTAPYPSFPFGVMRGVITDKSFEDGRTILVVEPPGGDCTPFNHNTCYMVECSPYTFSDEWCRVAEIGGCVEIEGFHRPHAIKPPWVGRLVRLVAGPPCPEAD